MIRFLASLFAAFGLAHPAWAWNAEGHMVVAQIAYKHLDPAVKAKCDALIAAPLTYGGSGTSNFVTASVWADDYKGSLGTAIWHYIDLPFSLDGTPTDGVATASSDVVQAINLCVASLLSSSETQSNRAVNLRYLLHFVGDIHQPLHCSTAVSAAHTDGDAGGNLFYLTGSWGNLHSLWDAGGGYLNDSLSRPLGSSSQTTLSNKVTAIEADYPYTPTVGTIPDPMNWAQEGLGLAQSVSYVGITQNSTPSSAYLSSTQSTTEQRMAQAGHRLADLLTTIFATEPIRLAPLTPIGGKFGFSWSAVSGRTYSVQWKRQFSDPAWNALTNVTASGDTASFAESVAQTQRFYRVVQ